MSESVPFGFGEKVLSFFIFAFIFYHFVGGFWFGALVTCGIFIQLLKLHRKNCYFVNLGIPGPPPKLLLGNFFEQIIYPGIQVVDKQWKQKYGKIYGTFMFTQPDLVIWDLDVMKQIFVKDFQNFINRRDLSFFTNNKEAMAGNLLSLLKDDEWKNVRNTVTPAFTGGKLRNMEHTIDECVKTFLEILELNNTDDMNIKELISGCTMDIIASTAFATKINCQRDPNDLFFKNAQAANKVSFDLMMLLLFPSVFYYAKKWFGLKILSGNKLEDFFVTNLTKLIKEREKHPMLDKPDFLQIVINASRGEEKVDNSDEFISQVEGGGRRVPLTNIQIISQCFLFLAAGYETTALTMTCLIHALAWHQNIQEKCFEEISNFPSDHTFTYNDVQQKLPYLETVIAETLRLYPPAVRVDRTCKDNRSYNGVDIPAGVVVSFPIYAIHHDEEYYPQPDKFLPERFTSEEKANRNPLTYMPFGYGPRNCIGMRFAQMEMKMILANVIRKFRIVPGPKTEKFPLKMKITNLLRPANTVYIKLEKR